MQSGKVDVFSVDLENGQPAGPRMHLFRAEAGEILLGLDHSKAAFGLLAVAVMGTSLKTVPRSRLPELARDPAHSNTIATCIEKWTKGLLSGIHRGPLPLGGGIEPTPGEEMELDDGQSVSPHSGILWIIFSEGVLRLFGREDFPQIQQDRFFPLCDRTWLESAGKMTVRSVDTAAFLAEDTSLIGLDAFGQQVLECIGPDRRQSEQHDQKRMKATAEVNRAALESVYTQLASATGDKTVSYEEPTDDSLLAACQMVGRAADIVIRPHPATKRGVKQKDPLANIAKASRMRTRKVLLKDNWWRKDAGPLLAFLKEGNRPVAIQPTKQGRYELWDPVEDTREPVTSALAASLNPSAYVFYRTLPDRALSGKEVLQFWISSCRSDILRIVLMGIAAGLLGLVPPIVTGILFDYVIPDADLSQLLTLAIALAVSATAMAFFHVVRGLSILRIEGKVDWLLEAAIWDRLMNLPLSFFRKYTSGDLAMRAMGVSIIRRTASGAVVSTVLGSLFSLFSVALLFYYSWRLAILATVIILISTVASAASAFVQFRYQRPYFDLQGKIQGMVLQFISGIAKLRVSGAESRALSSWAGMFADQKRLSYKSRKVSAGFSVFTGVVPILSSMAIYGYVAFSGGTGMQDLTTGSFLSFTTAFMNVLIGGITMITSLFPVLMAIPVAERLKPILSALPEVNPSMAQPGELGGHVEASHISFRYNEDGPMILKGLSFSTKPGEFVAIVGPSGSGKSTLFRLLLGFESPDAGSIYYDDQDIAGFDIQAVRSQIGVVLQNSTLRPGSILDNIIGASLKTIDDAWEAARMCGLAEDIEAMPMGIHTMVSEGGGGLSGGQQQRILIARAVVHRPRILFFDEATSALDNRTQAIVSKSLEGLKATRIVIAHRLSTIINADRIFVLVNGGIEQTGTYEELINQPGLFADLAKRQVI
ncbi:MAG: NHLP bacteriocin export ABC transporter permease/ATPase subunit [bacterium]|nr:NHLP bacteriocin export ABC transporter permease/ATPase subunit [bacterium]